MVSNLQLGNVNVLTCTTQERDCSGHTFNHVGNSVFDINTLIKKIFVRTELFLYELKAQGDWLKAQQKPSAIA